MSLQSKKKQKEVLPMNKIKIHDTFYWLDKNIINIETVIEKPDFLVKFYPLNENAVDCLINSYFYAAHPWEVNDPYEMFTHPNEGLIINRQEFTKICMQNGIVSMSHPINLFHPLMWAHYSNHCGYVILFDYQTIISKYHGPFPMNYMNKYLTSNEIDEFRNEDLLLRMAFLATLKHDVWKYENEWRFISYTTLDIYKQPEYLGLNPEYLGIDKEMMIDRKMKYELRGIKQILLGPKFSTEEPDIEFDKNTIWLKTENILKSKILDFIIMKKIKCSFLSFNNINNFGFGDLPVSISKENNTYIIQKLS